MNQSFSDITAYFQELSEQHNDIAHTETEQHFYRFGLEDVLTGIKTGINYPAISLEGYDYGFNDNESGGKFKNKSIAFMALTNISEIEDPEERTARCDAMEDIIDEFIRRMLEDRDDPENDRFLEFDLNNVTVQQLPLFSSDGLAVVRCTILLQSQFIQNTDPEKWTKPNTYEH